MSSLLGKVKAMKTARPSRTTNRLHFDDLDPRRFEDLCHSIIYPLRDWKEMSHPGRSGSDEGIDIVATEIKIGRAHV